MWCLSPVDTKTLEFSQYQKSDKTPSIVLEDLESLIEKLLNVKLIPKNHLQQSYVNIFPVDIQCLRYRRLMVDKGEDFIKIYKVYTEVKIAWKCFVNL